MSLRRQLLFVGLLTLLLPWAGCQYITELESALRAGQKESLQDSANAIASILEERRQILYRYRSSLTAYAQPESDLYAYPINVPITIDGFKDDWPLDKEQYRTLQGGETTDGTLSVTYALGGNRNYLYVFLAVVDDQVIYQDDAKGPTHDSVRMIFWDSLENFTEMVVETSAPGGVRAKEKNPENKADRGQQITGNWQATSQGYNLELQIPQSLLGPRFGFAVIDGDAQPLDPLPFLGTVDPYDLNPFPGLLNQPLPELENNVADLSQQNRRLRVLDRHGWILSQGGQLRSTQERSDSSVNLLDRFYRLILDPRLQPYPDSSGHDGQILGPDVRDALNGKSSSIWYQPQNSPYTVVSASAPIRDGNDVTGVVTLEQTSAVTLLLTNNALKRILSVTFLSTALVVTGLLGFATILSLRIRQLRNATEHAVADDGNITTQLPGADANDELGDLSRSFQSLLTQLKRYNEYLRSLASKLSHELRTPLAVVQSSLDNLQSQELSEQSAVYAQRANTGAARLRHIVAAMSAASRVEQSIETAEFDTFDLAGFVREVALGYQDTYPDFVIDAQTPLEHCDYLGVADLLAQMLDKLIENAVDFTPVGGSISFGLERHPGQYLLRVTNEGPPLPDGMKNRLFDSLISLRDSNSGQANKPTHLGFGLFIARLVVNMHGGDITADNLPGDDGVEFRIRLPIGRRIKSGVRSPAP